MKICTLISILCVVGIAAACSTKYTHGDAAQRVHNTGIGISSSGQCTNRNVPTCTSLEQVCKSSIDGIITLKQASGCDITITGGTETGHASGTYSHWNGYKVI